MEKVNDLIKSNRSFLMDMCTACEYEGELVINGVEHCGPCRTQYAKDHRIPHFTFKTKKCESVKEATEVTVSVPSDMLRHIYFALCAAKQKDPDSVQLAYLLDNLRARWPDCTTKYTIPVDIA